MTTVRRGFRYDRGNSKLEVVVDGKVVAKFNDISPSLTLDSALPVASGGTNATSLNDKAVLITQDSGTDTVAAAVMDANGELLIGGTSGPAVATLTQGSNITITNGNGTITIAGTAGGASTEMAMVVGG
mgnify:CR=1 FL=1|jgi:hypothetical protein